MSKIEKNHRHVLSQSILVTLVLLFLEGCAEPRTDAPGDDGAPHVGSRNEINPQLPSAHSYLDFDDAKKFRSERHKSEILMDIWWRGDFRMAGQYQKGTACAIAFDIVIQGTDQDAQQGVFAVFVDDKFVKFVEWFPAEMIYVPVEGTTQSFYKPIKIGDVHWLARALEKKAVVMADLQKELKSRPPTPTQVDPGLTIAYLLLRALGKVPATPDAEEQNKQYNRNAELRDQFNAARLNIGMTESEVEALFKAKPLETGETTAGMVRVYGSDEIVDVDISLAYSNVFVLFEKGKASAIYAIEGGPDWRKNVLEQFADFPQQQVQ